MLLDRVAKFGFVGAIGTILISLGTFGLIGIAWAERTAGFEGKTLGTILIIWIGGRR